MRDLSMSFLRKGFQVTLSIQEETAAVKTLYAAVVDKLGFSDAQPLRYLVKTLNESRARVAGFEGSLRALDEEIAQCTASGLSAYEYLAALQAARQFFRAVAPTPMETIKLPGQDGAEPSTEPPAPVEQPAAERDPRTLGFSGPSPRAFL